MSDSFPRQKARTRNFTLGAPRSVQVAADGSRVVFLRSAAGDDPRAALWVCDADDGRERLVAEPSELLGGSAAEDLSPQEKARRERMRETSEGIVGYATDADARLAAFALSGRLFVADLVRDGVEEMVVPTPVLDPRPDRAGAQVAFVHDRALHAVRLADGMVRRLAGEPEATVTWGLAEFVAAEEMDRDEGYWWAPDGSAVLAARVDESAVRRWWIADPAHPDAPPQEVRYPAAGSPNATVSVHVLRLDGADAVELHWDRARYPYLAGAHWDDIGPLLVVQSRDQRTLRILAADPGTGTTSLLAEQTDEAWVELVGGQPRRLADGRLVTVATVDDRAALCVAGAAVTGSDVEVRAVHDVTGDAVVFTASTDPTQVHVWRWSAAGGVEQLTTAVGVHTAVAGGGRCVVMGSSLEHDGARWDVGGHVLRSRAEVPVLTPAVRLHTVGERALRVGLVLPRGHEPGTRLPVLVDPYGGPGAQRVLATRGAWREPQWWADQGFAVLVVDGRGTPGRGRSWARAIHGDLAGPVLEDQVTALSEVGAREGDLDLSRVGIRGWSFGGFLAALAVLRRPDVFHAAVAGAPVTEWRLYDTHYTERYLGIDPEGADRDAYDGSSLWRDAASLRRPLLLIHGLADDNVVAAHTLLFSQRLTEAGRPHSVLPLTGVTHMTPQERVAENLLLLQVDFLHHALGTVGPPRPWVMAATPGE